MKARRAFWTLLSFTALITALQIFAGAATQANKPAGPGRVRVLLWFDTEDYILPQSDDAAKRIADFLSSQGIRGTFKLVGEKARMLQRRGRKDVIASLKRHAIGYHANTHSQHPTPAEYESTLDWERGVEEFTRREKSGFDDIHRIFDRTPCCYGQPGNSWAPQAFGALNQWGVRIYLDDAPHVGLDGKPFWYGRLLNIFNLEGTNQLRPNDNWTNLPQVEASFRQLYERLSARPEGGVVSIYFHPTEFIHRQFWDLTNFAHGANPSRAQWKPEPIKTPEEQARTFAFFEDFVRYMKSFPQVQFLTGPEALEQMPDRAQRRNFSPAELDDIAKNVGAEAGFQDRGDYTLAPGEILLLLNAYVAANIQNRPQKAYMLTATPWGPSSREMKIVEHADVSWDQFSRTVLDVQNELQKTSTIPNAVWMGSTAVSPESYLVALAGVARTLLAGGKPPATIALTATKLGTAHYVADDSPALWNWPIFPERFDAPHLMVLARLQAWTLKPAKLQASK